MSENLSVEAVKVEGRDIKTVGAVGLIVTWTPSGEANEQSIKNAFDGAGLGTFAPKPRALKEALKTALVEEYSKKNTRVAPVSTGYEVLHETPVEGEFRVDTSHVLSAWIEKAPERGGVEQIRCDDAEAAPGLVEKVENARKRVEGAAVGEALALVAQNALNGVRIRDGGGAYWIPQSSVATWFTLADALDTVRGGVTTRPFTVSGDDRTVKSLVESAVAKVEADVANLYEKIGSGTLGAKALVTQAEGAVKLAEQIAVWESTLGESLASLRAKVEDAQVAASQAAQIVLAAKEAA
jgi:hypothetical protein